MTSKRNSRLNSSISTHPKSAVDPAQRENRGGLQTTLSRYNGDKLSHFLLDFADSIREKIVDLSTVNGRRCPTGLVTTARTFHIFKGFENVNENTEGRRVYP